MAIDTALSKAGITVPKLVAYDFDKGFMLISDLGDKTFANASAQGDKLYYYQKQSLYFQLLQQSILSYLYLIKSLSSLNSLYLIPGC